MFHRHDRTDPAVEAARAEVQALLQRLGHDVSTLDDQGDARNRQALADASERYNTAGAQMSEATSVQALAVVRQIAVEGLHSTRLVRTRLGLDPGPDPAEVPVAPAAQPQPQPQPGWAGPRPGGGLFGGGGLGAGIAGGLLGMLAGEALGDAMGGDDRDGGWGDDQGGWGDDQGGGW